MMKTFLDWLRKFGGWVLAGLAAVFALATFGGNIRGRRDGRRDAKADEDLDVLDAKRAKLLSDATSKEREAIRLGNAVKENEAVAREAEERIRQMSLEELAAEYNRVFGSGD